MHELLTGRKPRDWDFPPFEEFGVQVPHSLAEVIATSLGIWPDERYASAEEMSQALKSLPDVSYSLPQADSSDRFEEAVPHLQDRLYPQLQNLITRYSNECHTPYLPKNLDFFEFTLASPTPFTLRIVKNLEKLSVDFYEKQGILGASLLDSVNPLNPGWEPKVDAVVKRFVADYEDSKNGGWGIGLM